MNLSVIKAKWLNSVVFKAINKSINKYFIKKLTNDEFTILCSNCVGGVLYHRLEKQFLSPTINMWFTQPDFVKFLLHLDEYLVQELSFIKTDCAYPVATLGGEGDIPLITLHFNHETIESEARNKWERRKKRINRENLYVILYNLDGITEKEIHSLDNFKCNNKVILTKSPLNNVEWAHQIIPDERGAYPSSYLGKDLFGVRWLEKKFDFVGFLNKRS